MEFTFSHHALERILDMALTADDVKLILNNPERTSPSRLYDDDCTYYIRGKAVLVVSFTEKRVVTALWNRRDADGKMGERFTRDLEEDLKRTRGE